MGVEMKRSQKATKFKADVKEQRQNLKQSLWLFWLNMDDQKSRAERSAEAA